MIRVTFVSFVNISGREQASCLEQWVNEVGLVEVQGKNLVSTYNDLLNLASPFSLCLFIPKPLLTQSTLLNVVAADGPNLVYVWILLAIMVTGVVLGVLFTVLVTVLRNMHKQKDKA